MTKSFTQSVISLACFLTLSAPISPAGEPETRFAPKFFAFENGLASLPISERIQILKELGYDGIGSARPNNIPERLKQYDKAGLDILSLYVGGKLNDGETGHTYDPALAAAITQLKSRETVIELYVQSGGKNSDEQAAVFVREIADLAKASGLNVVLYPHAGFYIDTLSDAVRIAKLSGRDNVGAMFNLCHFLKVEPGADLRATLESAGDLLWRASTNGADAEGKDWNSLIQPLDQGTYDQTILLRTLREVGFKGDIGLQCYAVRGDPKSNLKRSIEAWHTHLAKSQEPQ